MKKKSLNIQEFATSVQTSQSIEIDIGVLFENQLKFCRSKRKRVGYGGARGGGKTHVLCSKAIHLALTYGGVRIVIVRRSFKQLEGEILPKLRSFLTMALKAGIVTFNTQRYEFTFPNGATIKLGHYASEADSINYQGMNYDIIFMDEATQFTESMYRVLTLCNRLSGFVDMEKHPDFYPRMYFTCNPGGVGHLWFKRLFIDKIYTNGECAEDFDFIPSLVYDNKFLMEHNPEYVANLEALPEKQKQAMLYGDWSVFEGQFFDEFDEEIHVYNPRETIIPDYGRYFRTRDYGLDKTACYWIKVIEDGTAYVYRELWESNLVVSASGSKINSMTKSNEEIFMDICPPDMWNRNRDTGRSAVDILQMECGQIPYKANNDREIGWQMVKEWLKINPKTGKPFLMISSDCVHLIESLKMIQHDEKKPNDCAKEPHEVTHSPDAIRYFCVSYARKPDGRPIIRTKKEFDPTEFALNLGIYEEKEKDNSEEGYITWGDSYFI